MGRGTSGKTVRIARRLRAEMTLPEVLLWRILRGRPEEVQFRQQHPVGRYVLDFYAPEARVGIEVDGAVHGMGEQPARDEVRDAWLAAQGIRVVRVAAADVLADAAAVVAGILGVCLGDRGLLIRFADEAPPSALRAATSPLPAATGRILGQRARRGLR